MKKILKKAIIEQYKGEGWKQQVQICGLDPFLAKASYWEVIPEARIYIACDNEQSGKLAQEFQNVWVSLPSAICDKLIAYWQAKIDGHLPGVPRIEANHDVLSVALTSKGLSFEFNASIIEAMPNKILQDVIAHELGHAWNFTFADSLISSLPYEQNQAAIEWEADLAAIYWGQLGELKFDMLRWRQWAASKNDLVKRALGHTEKFVLPPFDSLAVKPSDPKNRI